MKLYSTVLGEASAEQVIEKSRFIAYVSPVQSREEADAFIASIRKKHKDATHNVPAIVLGEKMQVQKVFQHIFLRKGERSVLSELASKLL